MFICDTHCDTVSELYKNDVDFYANKQHIDVERIIKNGGGLQFCALFIPTEQFRYYGGIRYTLTLLDKYKTELKKLAARGVDVHPILTRTDAAAALQHQFTPLLAIEEGGALDGSLADLRPYGRRPELELGLVLLLHREEVAKRVVDRLAEVAGKRVVELRRIRHFLLEESGAELLRLFARERHEEEIVHPGRNRRTPVGFGLDTLRKFLKRPAEVSEETTCDGAVESLLGSEVAVRERRIDLGPLADLADRGEIEARLGKLRRRGLENGLARFRSVRSFPAIRLHVVSFALRIPCGTSCTGTRPRSEARRPPQRQSHVPGSQAARSRRAGPFRRRVRGRRVRRCARPSCGGRCRSRAGTSR